MLVRMNSGLRTLFDEEFYLRQEDICLERSRDVSFDAFEHFQKHGISEGRSPSFAFDINFVHHKLARYLGIKIQLSEVIATFLELAPAERFVPNGWFSPWSFRRLYGPVYDEIESLPDYELFEYYMAHVAERALSPNGLFNEQAYRARYPDVARAVEQQDFRSGFLHFVYHGAADGRINLPGFSLLAYAADRNGETEKDYVLAHHAELQRVVPWFDESFYLSVYGDAHDLKRREAIRSGLEHFLVLGFSERRIPHPAMLDDMAEPGTDSPWSFFAAHEGVPPPQISLEQASRLLRHLSRQEPGRDRQRLAKAVWPFVEPPPVAARFDEASYLAVNTDVAHALAGAPPGSAMVHWREFGLYEQRVAPGTNVFVNRTVSRADFPERCRGVNFFGPLSASSGLGIAAHGFISALRSVEVSVDTYDVSRLISRDLPLDLFAASDLAYPINFFFLNPDQVLPLVHRFGTALFDHRANVACWVWELASPRLEWRAALAGFDLIVTPSDFCTASFATFTNRPVVTCPYVVDEALLRAELCRSSGNHWIARLEAEKAAGKRVVLFIMDASSYTTRKGVDVFLAMVARLEADHPGRCTFVLKTHSKDYSKSSYRVNDSSVLVINEVLKFPDLVKLKSLADVYVSPHRSEGFGLNIFEALALGVPTLCSIYGGGMDLLPEDYPFRIPGRLAEVGRDLGPYRRHAVWFEPSVDAACDALVEMLGKPPQNGRFGQIAESIRSQLSKKAVGTRLRQILEEHCALNAEPTDAGLRRFAFLTTPPIDECFELGLPPGLGEAARQERLRKAAFQSLSPFFTIVTPTYNTPPEFLNELYQDLVAQSFPGWEWCVCDDGSSRPETLLVLGELRRKDARVRVKFLPKNVGIAAATNAAVATANGTYLLMVDHDDRVHPELLRVYHEAILRDDSAAILYCDEDKLDLEGRNCEPFFKPDWSPEHIMSAMYVLHCLCIRKSEFLALDGYRSAYDGAQDHDFVLRAAAAAGATIRHVDELLYHWRKTVDSMAASSEAKEFAIEAGRRAVADYLSRLNVRGTVEHGLFPGTYRVRPVLPPDRVSLNILSACTQVRGERQTYVERFVRSILAYESPVDFEIRVVVDHDRLELAAPLAELDARVQLVPFRRSGANFSFAEKANFAAATSGCDRIVLLNDDMEATDPGWLPALLEPLELPGVGVVGGRLLHDDGTIQHAGIVLGIYGGCAHVFEGLPAEDIGYNGLTHMIRNYSAVTGALMAFRRSTFDLVRGFDPDFPIDYNDVDFCLRVIESGLRIVCTPFAVLKHFESRSAKRMVRDQLDTRRFRGKWSAYIARDPYYNRNLSRDSVIFGEPVRAAAIVAPPPEPARTDAPPELAEAQPMPASVRKRLIELLGAQGLVVTDEPNLYLVINGRAIHPSRGSAMVYRFELPGDIHDLRIVSRSHVPSSVYPESEDTRRLGVCLSSIVLHADGVRREIPVGDPALGEGFHPMESNGEATWRWTDGDARLAVALLNGAATTSAILELQLLWPGAYWIRPEQLPVARETIEPQLQLQ